jgi:hypothetical protein
MYLGLLHIKMEPAPSTKESRGLNIGQTTHHEPHARPYDTGTTKAPTERHQAHHSLTAPIVASLHAYTDLTRIS